MKTVYVPSGLRELRLRTNQWFLITVLGLSVAVSQAQSSVTVKVEARQGAVVSDVKVLVKNLKSGEVLDVPETGTRTGKYTIERLKRGSYNFFACDDHLDYAPDSNPIELEENTSKKFTLVLGEKPGTLFAGTGAGAKRCVRHRATGCEATKDVDQNGNIPIRGLAEEYDVVGSGACAGGKTEIVPRKPGDCHKEHACDGAF
jgi:hypothetical protein